VIVLPALDDFELADGFVDGAQGFVAMAAVVVFAVLEFRAGITQGFEGSMDMAMMRSGFGGLSAKDQKRTCRGERGASKGAFGEFHAG